MVCAALEDRDFPQNPEIRLPCRAIEAAHSRAPRQSAGHVLYPQLAHFLADDAKPLDATGETYTRIYTTRNRSAEPPRQARLARRRRARLKGSSTKRWRCAPDITPSLVFRHICSLLSSTSETHEHAFRRPRSS